MTWVSPRARQPSYWAKVLIPVGLLWAIAGQASEHYRIGIDLQHEQCLPYRVMLLELGVHPIEHGSYVAVRAARFPRLDPGETVVKKVVGMAGDSVSVRADTTTVNGAGVAGPLDLAERLDMPLATLERTMVVQSGELFVVGTLPGAYDSRYVGPVPTSDVVARAIPIW